MNFKPGAPINFSSVRDILETNEKIYGLKPSVITVNPHTLESFSINYSELKSVVFNTAAWLEKLGIRKGDRFSILMHNTAEVLIFELAGALIGATAVPLDSKRDTLERKLFKIKQTRSKALFETVGDESAQDIEEIKKKFPEVAVIGWSNFEEFKKLIGSGLPGNIYEGLDKHYVILYTSGTTNMPKGVPLKASSCLLNAAGIAKWQKFTEEDVFNLVLPLHHINSTIFALALIISGGSIVMNTTYSASGFWKVIEKFGCTNSSIVPTILHDLLVRVNEYRELKPDTSSLKRICIGSAPVLPDQTLKFADTFKVRVIQGYGQTETALRVTGVPVDLEDDSYKEMVRLNSTGLALANCEVDILDENNNPKKEGEEGEVCISGPVLGDGYLDDLEATVFSFKKGWFHSGDLGYFKNMQVDLKNGQKIKGKFFFIVGRLKEIIIKGGVNISPSAIEDVLLKTFNGISEVSVIGIPDSRMGEEVAAVVVTKEGISPDKIRKEFNSKEGVLPGLSSYEFPKRIFFMDSLPKTSTGKIQRVEVKKMIVENLKEESPHFFVRQINPDEDNFLEQAVKINNDRFTGLPATIEEFRSRAKNGKLFGVFDDSKLVGSLTCMQVDESDVKSFRTWDEATAQGTLKNNNPNGDSLLCVAISVEGKNLESGESKVELNKLEDLAGKEIEDYIKNGNDYVLKFHAKIKAGIPGAKVYKILKGGRVGDADSLGYNVIVKYPEINKNTKLTADSNASASIKLIEYAIFAAKELGLKNIYAFSRPAGFKNYLEEKYG